MYNVVTKYYYQGGYTEEYQVRAGVDYITAYKWAQGQANALRQSNWVDWDCGNFSVQDDGSVLVWSPAGAKAYKIEYGTFGKERGVLRAEVAIEGPIHRVEVVQSA